MKLEKKTNKKTQKNKRGDQLGAELVCVLSARVPVQTSRVYTISILLRLLAVWEERLFGRQRKATNDKPSDKHKQLTSEAGLILVHEEAKTSAVTTGASERRRRSEARASRTPRWSPSLHVAKSTWRVSSLILKY